MRTRCLAAVAALAGSAVTATRSTGLPVATQKESQQRLAVVVPAYVGDLDRAVSSLGRWPSSCSPITQQNVDLVLYYAEGEEDAAAVDAAAAAVAQTAGRCFSKTLTVYAHLSEEEDAYPKGPSVMFYKMFLDEGVRADLSEYDALAIIEWDVLVATDRSFEELYHAAFRVNEDFWVKGSNLEGTNFHSSSTYNDMWHVLGHINGNAIYNNNDPRFVEYVDYTLARWDYTYPYDVALWLTISDFPYSWPLYQRFSTKFVTTNLIAYVGYEHVDHGTVTDAIAGETLFIHGKNVDEGSNKSVEEVAEASAVAAVKADAEDDNAVRVGRKLKKWSAKAAAADDEEAANTTRELQTDPYRRQLKDTEKESARVARKLQKWKTNGAEEEGAETQRELQTDPYRRQLAAENDSAARVGRKLKKWSAKAAEEEEAANATRELQTDPYRRQLAAENDSASRVGRKLKKWAAKAAEEEEEETTNATRELQTDPYRRQLTPEKESVRAARKLQKLKTNFVDEEHTDCLDGCEFTSKDGTKGRVCDSSCEDGDPYGTKGCAAKRGKYGPHCRACYNDVELALVMAVAGDENPAVMCDTLAPVDPNDLRVATPELSERDEVGQFFEEEGKRMFTDDVPRGGLCAFVAGTESQLDQVEVTVTSILEFLPGMRVAIAAEDDAVEAYRRTVGDLPGVTVSPTAEVLSASLFADEYCGEGTSLIYYVKHGSVVSRTFTSKDTHSPHGDLLVVFGTESTAHTGALAERTAAALGFEAPSFTAGTDLFLPVEANADLRSALAPGGDDEAALEAIDDVLELGNMSAVPQMLAALQYKRATTGMWFFNPSEWVTKHLFQAASIWEIPLVKPRFACEIYPSRSVEEAEVAGVLRRNLDFFAMGGTCEGGTIAPQA
eukprot:g6521.t1